MQQYRHSVQFLVPFQLSVQILLEHVPRHVKLQLVEELMEQAVPFVSVPELVELSDVLLPFEQTQLSMPGNLVKLPRRDGVGPAFHEKIAKNKKVNIRYDHKKAMMDKYGKPKKRRNKK
jgi:ATP-dependent RNA helicase RhlE